MAHPPSRKQAPALKLARPSVARWQAGFAMADARVKAELRARGPDPLRSVAIALSMIGAVRARPGPHYDDPVRRRGVEQVRAIWQRLREATFASEARRPTELERVPPPLWRRSSVLSRR